MSRVLIEASPAFDQGAGIGRYSRNIIDRLVSSQPEVAWTLFHAPERRGQHTADWSPPDCAPVVTYPLTRHRFDQLSGRLGLPLPVRPFSGAQHLVYSPDFVAPSLRSVPRIVTIHDLAFITHPHLTTPGTASFLRRAVEREARRGAYFATVSESSRDRVLRLLRVPEERVRTIRNGVDARFLAAESLSPAERTRLGVPERYLLMVGTIEPRKNHQLVINAFRSRADSGLPLVIAGRPGWGTEHLLPELAALERAGKIRWLRQLHDDDLPGLYAGATGALYPSWTEGFGLPVIEALAAGLPVVTGNDPVFQEIGGPHVVQIDPSDVQALLEAIRELESSSSHSNARAQRRAWAARYNWDEPVAHLARWMHEILEGRGA